MIISSSVVFRSIRRPLTVLRWFRSSEDDFLSDHMVPPP